MGQNKNQPAAKIHWRHNLNRIIFGSETPAGKLFDVLLIASILISVLVVMLDSVKPLNLRHGVVLHRLEWFFTVLFTVEYILRLICIKNPFRYAISIFGIIDFLAILPTYMGLFMPGAQYFLVLRILRVLRIFRVLKLVQYISEADLLITALKQSARKIIVFLFTVISLMIVFGALIYAIEGEANGFTSIPRSIYWAIVTMTTVGYGDISPQTPLGQSLAAFVMVIGYSILAVPTGIVTVEMSQQFKKRLCNRPCPNCGACDHIDAAKFCHHCGTNI